jgi:hypothetical protein
LFEPFYPPISQRGDSGELRVLLGSTGRSVGVITTAALPLYANMSPSPDIVLKK